MNNKLLNKIKFFAFILLFGIFSSVPIVANASEIPVEFLGAYQFQDHRGMVVKVNGRYVYCIERGNPFRSFGSDMQMIWTEATGGGWGGTYTKEGYLSEVLGNLYSIDGGADLELEFFRGWGQWVMNEDKTDAYQVGTDGAPSSTVWLEDFDEDKEDDEDPKWDGRYLSGELGGPRYTVRKFLQEVGVVLLGGLTGHEGAVEPYPTTVKRITYGDVGLSEQQVFAMAITQYYCWEDPDSEVYDERVRYAVKQALDWGIEFNFITTIGGTGDSLRLIYQDSTGNYGVHKANTFSGTSDGYIKTTIGTYEELKLYRQVVWKTTNMRVIPSFASKQPGGAEPIKLYWDEEQHLYTATVSDHNGVLNYFDFNVPGCTVTNNGDGTLTISASGSVNATSGPSKSKLEPEDGVFNLPAFFRWTVEGEEGTFKYTTMVTLRQSTGMEPIA